MYHRRISLGSLCQRWFNIEISKEELEAIVEAGRTAPIAGADFSMSHMTVVQSPELIAEIRATCQMTCKDGTKVNCL